MLIDGIYITPVKSVRDLGIYIDADLSMRMHLQKTVSCCFATLRQLHQICRSVPASTFQKLVVALVHFRLDYGNSVLVGIPACLIRRLQSVLNAAAWLIFNLKRSDHISDALISFHWLGVLGSIQYKIAVLSYKVLHDTAPRYLVPLTRVADIPGQQPLRSASTYRLAVPRFKLSNICFRAHSGCRSGTHY